jgi:serine/threonine protein kinase
MIFGEYPYSDTDREQLIKKILSRKICVSRLEPNYIGIDASKNCLDFIDKMLAHKPEERFSVVDALHHPWLRNKLDQEEDFGEEIANNTDNIASVTTLRQLELTPTVSSPL